MREPFLPWYLRRAKEQRSVFCVGLDPKPEHLPKKFGVGTNVGCMTRYLMEVIDIAADKAAVVKPQRGYYGAYGPRGYEMLTEIVEYAHFRGLPVILDAKVSDIGETMFQYGIEVFDHYGVDACTFVPYLGRTLDVWLPWFKKGRMAIPMILTSNPEAKDLQMLELADGRLVYQAMADIIVGWTKEIRDMVGQDFWLGGVVGATQAQAADVRDRVGLYVPFLTPGYGAQGGGADGAVAGFPATGELYGFVNSSRDVTLNSWRNKLTKRARAGDPMDWVRRAIEKANVELNDALFAKLGFDPYAKAA